MSPELKLVKPAFESFATENSLKFKERRFSSEASALDYIFPVQEGLHFEFILGLTGDELHIGYHDFWTYIFPANEKIDWVISLANRILRNECRLVIYKKEAVVVKRVLESFDGKDWTTEYSAHEKVGLPFQRLDKTYLYNTADGKLPLNR